MKDLKLYSGFKLEKLEQFPTGVCASAIIDDVIYSAHLSKTCNCGIKDKIYGEHKNGCNTYWVPNYPVGKDVLKSKDKNVEIISVKRIRDYEYYDLVVKIGEILWDGWLSIDCTCGGYLTHRNHCQKILVEQRLKH